MSLKVNLKWQVSGVALVALLSVAGMIFHNFYMTSDESINRDDISSVLISESHQVFEPVLPNSPVLLPQDFALHPEFQHEWWHFFANVKDQTGQEYGIQWSYFRIASDERETLGWQNSQIYFSHIVISTAKQVWKEQRIARGGIGQAGINTAPFHMWIDNWTWRSLGKTPFPGHLITETDSFGLSLYSNTSGPFVLPGEQGYQKKHDFLPVASYNVQAPFLSVYGQMNLAKDAPPISVQGSGWMSKEWGSGLMAEGQQGWDSFVFDLNNTTKLSVSRYRHPKQLPYVFGTLSTTDGKVIPLHNADISMIPLNTSLVEKGRLLPLQWRIIIPKHGIDLTTSVINKKLWLPFVLPYWEGPIQTTGSHIAKGFMQLSGY